MAVNASRDLPKLVAAIAVGVFALLPMAKLPAFYDSFLYLVFFWVSLSTSWALLSVADVLDPMCTDRIASAPRAMARS